jgi:predicted dehydrogenase
MDDQVKHRFGIIGAGMIAEFHAKAIADIPDAELVAVYDRNPEKAKAFSERFSCEAHGDLDEFLSCDTTIVTVCTPSGAHLEPGMAVANAGKHVIVEKPVEVRTEKIDQLIECCDKNGVQLIAVFQRRFNASVQQLKQAVDQGRFGKIALCEASIKWWRTQEYYDSAGWRGTWALDGGGVLMNQGIHTIDLLLHMLGDVKSVCAYTGLVAHENIEVEDVAVAILEFESGVKGIIQGTTACWSKEGLPAQVQLCGDKGTALMSDDRFDIWEFAEKMPGDEAMVASGKSEQKAAGAADPKAIDYTWHKRNFEDALKAIDDGRICSTNGREGRRAVELIEAIYRSAKHHGTKVSLPLKGDGSCT